MPYLLGTDEAGYGPNLGPLVVAGSLWHVPTRLARRDLYEVLCDCVAPSPADCLGEKPRLPIADSKTLYQSGQGLATLERGLLPLLELIGRRPVRWSDAWTKLVSPNDLWEGTPAADWNGRRSREQELPPTEQHVPPTEQQVLRTEFESLPWHAGYDCTVPIHLEPEELAAALPLAERLARCKVRLIAIACRPIFPREFNAGCERLGNKASFLSHVSLQLAAGLMARCEPDAVQVVCDKHGGRNKYLALLQHFFPDAAIEIHRESLAESRYVWGERGRQVDVAFRSAGERSLPTAVASMAAKYLRELAMLAWNAFWRLHLPELRPTAGYPGDAARFHNEIRAKQQELGIADALLWRTR